MSQAANVRSLEALRDFRSALIKFIDHAKRSIATSDGEVSRVSQWLDSTQPMFWVQAIRKGEERLAQAKSELFRATISQPDNPRGPTDQVRLVKKRQAEIKHATAKYEKTKQWSRRFERLQHEYRSGLTPLSSALDGELQKVVVQLDNSIRSLEAYLSTTLAKDEQLAESQSTPESIARKGSDNTDEHADSEISTDESD
ncbi:MAG: hypothetical protein MK073_07550 [Phycisphaerales bacterium]|nr:hypothetical protein [Phycisphaerales bacterium]